MKNDFQVILKEWPLVTAIGPTDRKVFDINQLSAQE